MSAVESLFATVKAGGGGGSVIFVHGLTGDPVDTWSCVQSQEPEGPYWPRWLAADLPHLDFYTFGYPASIFAQWANKEMNLYQRAKSFLEILAAYEIGAKPVVFVCHSLGGLLVKQMIRTALESTDNAWKRIALSCHGVFFIATPHSGSSLASILNLFVSSFTSSHTNKLIADTSELDELNASFRSFCHSKQINVTSYFEMHKTKKVALVVEPGSADPGVNASQPIPIDGDHSQICKPVNRHAPLYLSVRRRILDGFPISTIDQTDGIGFECDGLDAASDTDRRDLHSKMIAADLEQEYHHANDSQNKFARAFIKNGLKSPTRLVYESLLADVEQRFQNLVYHAHICEGADRDVVAKVIQEQVIEPLVVKYAANKASAKTVMNAIYFLTERCHIRWDSV